MVERDGQGLTELEFVITMLLELGIVEEKVVKPFVKQFRTLDLMGNGRLGMGDLKLSLSMSEEQKAELMRSRSGKKITNTSLGVGTSTSPDRRGSGVGGAVMQADLQA